MLEDGLEMLVNDWKMMSTHKVILSMKYAETEGCKEFLKYLWIISIISTGNIFQLHKIVVIFS